MSPARGGSCRLGRPFCLRARTKVLQSRAWAAPGLRRLGPSSALLDSWEAGRGGPPVVPGPGLCILWTELGALGALMAVWVQFRAWR